MSDSSWKIHKFGGSSLADAGCFRRVADIVAGQPGPCTGVVVSAMRGTTDSLLRICAMAERDDNGFTGLLADLGKQYSDAAKMLLPDDALVGLLDAWGADADAITTSLKEVAASKTLSERTRDGVAGFGEIWSARLLAAYMKERLGEKLGGTWIDARDVISVHHTELGPSVIWDISQKNLSRAIRPGFAGVAVITGFIASDENGLQTTLGRNGSDYSAAIMAALTSASELTIWTDVDGVMSADPNRVPDAQVIESLTYSEAMELAYFGAKVIHPQTLGPAIAKNIPVRIRNTFNPEHGGSLITATATADGQIKGVTTVGDIALVNLEGAGMIGVPGTADRLFAALKMAGVSVSLISQASSEHSICVAVPRELGVRARDVIAEEFAVELDGGQMQSVDVTDAQSIIAVVGDGMAVSPGIAARFFNTLGRAQINIRAIAQGSSERNISAVVDSADATRALRSAHSGFYLSSKTISVGLIGPGQVGGALLDQLFRQRARLNSEFSLDLRVRAIARSETMRIAPRSMDLARWRVDDDRVDFDFDAFEEHVHADHIPHAVIVDCTSSDAVADRYAGWLERGIHVVTPNKKAFSGDLQRYDSIRNACRAGGSHIFYETTVGAALPVIRSLRDLVDTGDQVHSISGILSGTLAYLFNVYDGGQPFSEIVREARSSGYTEPDPRDDLSGMDVARKLTILARELGQRLNVDDFPVENLIPEALRVVEVDSFLERLAEYDDTIKARFNEASDSGKSLRYVASLAVDGDASVGLEAVDSSHPFCNIELTDNIIQYQSERYSKNPLILQGPGAGPEVTAGGVFGDLLRLAAYLGDGSEL